MHNKDERLCKLARAVTWIDLWGKRLLLVLMVCFLVFAACYAVYDIITTLSGGWRAAAGSLKTAGFVVGGIILIIILLVQIDRLIAWAKEYKQDC